MRPTTFLATLSLLAALALPAAALQDPPVQCLRSSGNAGAACLDQWTAALANCRLRQDPACEAALRAAGGALSMAQDRTEPPIEDACPFDPADALGYLGTDDVELRVREACADFGEDWAGNVIPPGTSSLGGAFLGCQREVTRRLAGLRHAVVQLFGERCFVQGARGNPCDHARRDRKLADAKERARRRIAKKCAGEFDALGLGSLDALVDVVTGRSRHFAQLVYPPNDLGPTSELGIYPVGIRTLTLTDPTRSNVQGTEPRPVTIEVYYPSTHNATANVPRDIVTVLGVSVLETPSFRDVARAPGTFPLVVFSHGNGGLRIQSFFFAAHLASHGYVVASPDHHGNTFVDALAGIVDPNVLANRPLDMHFVIDQMLAQSAQPGSFLAGAIDPARIGASGHSFGGLTTLMLASPLSGFADPRVKAIFPQAPAAPFSPEFFAAIQVPTLIVGGSIDGTTPFDRNQQRPFDLLAGGPLVTALAQVQDAGHFTFSDFCEVPRTLLGFLGGFDEACEPRHLPWRHAHDIVNYLSLNFFDATLRGDAEALGRLDPAVVGTIEDLRWQQK